ncbi:MAG: family peptidase [Chitinophagaceae bacterium]|nr:family peptidase [Chitinophagaceae bacterium]
MKKIFFLLLIFISVKGISQSRIDSLTVDLIMRDSKWMGTSPSSPYWSRDGYLFFNWNPDNKISDSVYFITATNLTPQKASYQMRQKHVSAEAIAYNSDSSAYTYSQDGDIYFGDVKKNKERRVTQTVEAENNPVFIMNNSLIAFSRNQNLYAWDILSGTTIQLTNFQKGNAPPKEILNAQEKWLKEDQLTNFEVLRSRKARKDSAEAALKIVSKEKEIRSIYYEDKILSNLNISPDGRFVTYRLTKPVTNVKATIVPNYITESGFTQDISGRTKVGAPLPGSEFFVFDRQRDTVLLVKTDQLPGIKDMPDFITGKALKDTTTKDSSKNKTSTRPVIIYGPSWNGNGAYAVVDIRSQDNKDRWLMLLDGITAKLTLLNRQRDEAWVDGPEILYGNTSGWIDDNTFWFQSEATGYSHLYKIDIASKQITQLTHGNFEVQQANLSRNKKYFYLITNQVHPGEQHFYRMPVNGGAMEKLTTLTGAHQAIVSPDEKFIADLYSYSNKPWELYLQENKINGKQNQVTNKAQSEAFRSYQWRDPEIITFTARDGATVYARLYKPANPHPGKPAVIFVHGAGYLQNAHKWWSTYFREYMFNNLLADKGYTVLDIDYRGSAGYGRNWRTGIYRHMGGKDLTDQVDGAKLLVEKYGINPKKIGLYGGSYGGFITLMAMFTQQETFAAGAALRSVTDWSNYNHGYTSNILNEPYTDTLAYRQSSPIYYAEGLKGALLMCHGMVDVNVHFQDIVRLTQRLIELKKENWELAVYPVEGHGFIEPSSWTDEYKRILKLFEMNLKK